MYYGIGALLCECSCYVPRHQLQRLPCLPIFIIHFHLIRCDAFYCALLFAFLLFFFYLLSIIYCTEPHYCIRDARTAHTLFCNSSPCIHIPPPGRSMPPLMCYHHPTLHHHRHHPTSSTDILIHVYLIPMALHNDQNCAYTLPTPNPSQPTLISAYSLISSLGSFIPLIPPFPSCIRDVSFLT